MIQLYLSKNKLKTIPDSINWMIQLKRLYLQENQLLSLPNISNLKNLEALWLENNNLEVLPDGL